MPLALMSLNTKLIIQFIILVNLFALNPNERVLSSESHGQQKSRIQMPKSGALLASRINTLEELNEIIQFDYFPLDSNDHAAVKKVTLRYPHQNDTIVAVLEEGIDQGMIVEARDGDWVEQVKLLMHAPYVVKHREDLGKIYILARRRRQLYGDYDKAFYDLAENSVKKINTKSLAFKTERDSSEKGYINTFNHVTAQSLITSIFGETKAAFIADVHERYNMPELVSLNAIGQLRKNGEERSIIDNYVDIINNKVGQKLGSLLRKKYNLSAATYWTPELLADYLNDMQTFYRTAFNIGMKPFDKEEELMVLFAKKLNGTLHEKEVNYAVNF